MSTATHYRHSNRVSILLFPIALAICGTISLLGAVVYAYCMVYVPVVQLAFLLPLIYGAGMGALLAFVLQRLKVRSALLGTGVAFLFAAGSYFLSWLPWTYATFVRAEADVSVLDVLFPPTLIEMIVAIYENGAWSIGTGSSTPVSGVMLGICWALEALFVPGAAPLTAYTVASGGVFCEGCGSWCHAQRDVMRLPAAAQGAVAPRLDAQDLTVLAETPRAQPYDNPFLRVDLHRCQSCGATNTLSLSMVTRTQQNGRETVQESPIVRHVLVSKDHADWVLRG